ncbi:hypothetical protein SAMD00079811_39450 [Scytonema sp. HK-05]|uniref:hypothetical protein n=1 Tax=Scytonema sp. HK-05 TaxID=1137095 RepID=UPI000A55788F|nr:hypothetical protein [Scytonema sp. HK-05]BAY46337.1 hypothetical protein SAMD00079811_39450 [Scytonema sp. HK-05]
MKSLSRRQLLQVGALAGGSLLLPLALQYRSSAQNARSPQKDYQQMGVDHIVREHFSLT